MILNENKLRQIIRESLMNIFEDIKYDDYGEEIPRGGQGWGNDDSMMNRQGYNADGTKGPWFSRSVAVATAVFLNDNGNWYVLANQRGEGTPDYQGRWNLPCGYLDYNEEAVDAAVREIREETGIKINRDNMMELGHSSSPNENRQNVCFFFATILNGSVDDFPFSTAEMEENEVSGIQWVPVENIGNYKWAFWHNRLLNTAMAKLGYAMKNNKMHNPYTCIENAIDLVNQGGSKEEIIRALKEALNLLQ